MNEEALHGTAVYNPGLLSRDELKRNFVARTELLEKLLSSIRREELGQAPQHRLLLGLRGMGKTTLLHRLAVAVKEDEKLNQNWMPLTFPEEQYNIANLADLWLNCLDAMSDLYDSQGEREQAEKLDKIIEALPKNSPDKALQALLNEAARHKQRLLLLIDNIDLVFNRLKDEDWALREVLQSNPNLLVMGASANAIEASYDYGAAFYDFFQVHELKGLSLQEMNDTLIRLAEINEVPGVIDLIKQDPARVTTLHTLTGGNPRTTVLLFSVLAQGLEGSDVRSDLEGLLDRVTPLYKARFEELPTKAQQLVDAIANHWDPVSAKQLAERLGWEVNSVSAQLSRIEQQAIVEKTAPSEGKRALFQLSERFFNIWYLMRSSRRVRNNLIWLVRFLRVFFSADELQNHARNRLAQRSCNQRDSEYLVALAQSIDDAPLRTSLENRAIHGLIDTEALYRMLEIKVTDKEEKIHDQLERLDRLKAIRIAIEDNLPSTGINFDKEMFYDRLLGSPSISLEDKHKAADRMAFFSAAQWNELSEMFNTEWDHWREIFGDVSGVLYHSIAIGEMLSGDDIQGAITASKRLEEPVLLALSHFIHEGKLPANIDLEAINNAYQILNSRHKNSTLLDSHGNFLSQYLKRYHEAEQAYRKAIEIDPEDANPWNNLGKLLSNKLNSYEDAEQAYRKVIELDPEDVTAWNNLGNLLTKFLMRFDEAEQAYRQAIKISPDNFAPWNNLGNLLANHLFRFDEAEEAYRQAIKINPENAAPCNNLGNLLANHLNHFDEAEQAYRKAIEINPVDTNSWNNLGTLLTKHSNRFDEAEQAYRKAIETDPVDTKSWNNLGNLLANHLNRFDDAELTYRKAIEIDPEYAVPWNGLGAMLDEHLKRYDEAEKAYRKAIEIDPEYITPWNNLGNLLTNHLKHFDEAEQVCRKAIEIEHENVFSWNALGNLLVVLKRFDEAEQVCRKVIEINPGDAAPWNDLGSLLNDYLERFDEAEESYRKAIEIDPKDATSWFNLGQLQSREVKRFEEAARSYRKAIELNPEYAAPQNGLAWLLYQKGESLPEALDHAKQANNLEPDCFYTLHTMVTLMVNQGQWHQAVPFIERMITEGSDDFHEIVWEDILSLFNEAVTTEHTNEALQLLDDSGAGVRWRPLREALAAIASGNENYLNAIAPEVREPAQKIVERLTKSIQHATR